MVVFSDGQFSSGWTESLSSVHVNNPSFVSSNPSSGGNPGAYRRESHTAVHDGSTSELAGFNWVSINTAAQYNPSTQGAIQTLAFSFDSILFTGNPAGYGLMLRQGGRDYRFFNGSAVPGSNWSTFSAANLTSASFHEILPSTTYAGVVDLASHPNFSNTGGNIQFGYSVLNGFGGSRVATTGIDNWSVSLTTDAPPPAATPEPSTFVAAGSALIALALRRRRHPPVQ